MANLSNLSAIFPSIPTSIIPSAAARTRSVMVAVVLGTALTAGTSKAAPAAIKVSQLTAPIDTTPDAVRELSRYCKACWKNARVPMDKWDDCTQQVLTRLLERVPPSRWSTILQNEDDDRREFIRAIDTVKKRTQRSRRFYDLTPDFADERNRSNEYLRDQRELVDMAAEEVLSPRQRRIVELSAGGWAVLDIARELGTTPERISDEKYKAIRKLRSHLGVDA